MSDLAIAAVTATLRSVVQRGLSDRATVTTLPLDKAEGLGEGNRVNLFLYQTTLNAAWRNQPIPTKVKPGERGFPPLALNLHYLITAYGDNQEDETDHRLLGAAMRSMYDHAVLGRADILNATSESPLLKAARLEQQYEPVKVTQEPMSLEEMSKLWTTFQAKYRVSVAYQASVVLIESLKQAPSALPVLKRGPDDQGVDVRAQLPGELQGVEYRDLRTSVPALPAAQLGDMVTLLGARLPRNGSTVVFRDPNQPGTPAEPNLGIVARLKPESDSTDERLYVRLDEAAGNWRAGQLNVSVEFLLPGEGETKLRSTNPMRFALAPTLRNEGGLAAVTTTEKQRRKLVVSVRPRLVGGAQGKVPELSLLLDSLNSNETFAPIPVDRDSVNFTAATPVFDVDRIPPGQYRVRLRVDTVESLPMQRKGRLLEFDPKQEIVL